MRPMLRLTSVFATVFLGGCAALGGLGEVLQAPRFEVATDRQAELRLVPPSEERPAGGATVRLWAHVENPNPVGLTLRNVVGDLLLEEERAADVEFPLGVPLAAGQDTVIPMEIALDLRQVPALADAAVRAVTGTPVPYRLNGTVGVDAGRLGEPSFGPATLLQGELRVRR